MKANKYKLLFIAFTLLSLFMCTLQKPVEVDNTGYLKIVVIDTTTFFTETKLNPVADF